MLTLVLRSLWLDQSYIGNNVLSTLAVARTCFEAGVPIIYLISAAVYGEPMELLIREAYPTNPAPPMV